MVSNSPLFNPANETFNFEYAKQQPFLFSNSLKKENCYNPLIAFRGKRILLDCYNSIYFDTYPKDMPRDGLPKDQETASKLFGELGDHRLPNLRKEYLLPKNRFRFRQQEAEALNATWYGALRLFRESVATNNLHMAIKGLYGIFNAFQKVGIPFEEFMKFKGLFLSCIWLRRGQERTASVGYNDGFYPMPSDTWAIPAGWELFVEDASRLRNYLYNCLSALGTPKTGMPGLERFQNAFEDLLEVDKIMPETFERLLRGCQDAGSLFEKKVESIILTPSADQNEARIPGNKRITNFVPAEKVDFKGDNSGLEYKRITLKHAYEILDRNDAKRSKYKGLRDARILKRIDTGANYGKNVARIKLTDNKFDTKACAIMKKFYTLLTTASAGPPRI